VGFEVPEGLRPARLNLQLGYSNNVLEWDLAAPSAGA
jgi:hypothetical protein